MFAAPSLDYRCRNISKTNNLWILQVFEKCLKFKIRFFFQVSSVKDLFNFPQILNSQVMSVQFPSSSNQIWYFWHVFFMFPWHVAIISLSSYHTSLVPIKVSGRSMSVPHLGSTCFTPKRGWSAIDKLDFQTLGKLLGPTFCPSKPLKRDGSCILDCIYRYK